MQCEMCGIQKEPSDLIYVRIEGSLLKVCQECGKHGEFVRKVSELMRPKQASTKAPISRSVSEPDHEEVVVDDFASRIRIAREKKGLTQKEFATAVNEKESLIHKIETGSIDISLALARKFERFFSISLIEEIEISHVRPQTRAPSESLTLGDIISIKKRTRKK